MNHKTLLVDAPYLLKRSIHGAKDSYTKAGYIGGLYSFMTTLRKLIKMYGVTKCILFWDGANSGFYRYKIDRAYKANRKGKEWHETTQLTEAQLAVIDPDREAERIQKMKVQEYAEELFIRQIEVEKIEADDLIAAYIIDHKDDEDMILYTNDRDYVQLLGYGVSIHYDSFDYPVSMGNYFMFFPYHYKNALTIKILIGDDSDNVAGIEGLGMTTLLKHFPELKTEEVKVRDILLKTKELNEARGKKTLKVFNNMLNGVDRLKKNFELMNLHQPILTDDAIDALEELENPLAETDTSGKLIRGSHNLINLMQRDDFLSLYSNNGNFIAYVEPFFTIIITEKAILQKFLAEQK
jgi:5'-3' exonuclease